MTSTIKAAAGLLRPLRSRGPHRNERPLHSERPAHKEEPLRSNGQPPTIANSTVDDLDLSGAVLGDGMLLSQKPGEGLRIHSIDGGRATLVGSFKSAAEAWRVLDDIDAPPEGLEDAA
jgi:hypothetical protein